MDDGRILSLLRSLQYEIEGSPIYMNTISDENKIRAIDLIRNASVYLPHNQYYISKALEHFSKRDYISKDISVTKIAYILDVSP